MLSDQNTDLITPLWSFLVDYILLDPEERKRLFIHQTPIPHPIYTIRSPVPWHDEMDKRRRICTHGLFVQSAMSLALNKHWHHKYVPTT